jgi:hypothetical protein
MAGFKIISKNYGEIRFSYYSDAAPVTSRAFRGILPFTRTFYHARVSGEEIWIDDVPRADIIQENASVFTDPGEAVLGPSKPARTKTSNCFGIYYGNGKGLDAGNIFAKVAPGDLQKLKELGTGIWKHGPQELTIAADDETMPDL